MQQLTYNGTSLNTLGKVVIVSQTVSGEPQQAPERWRRTIVLRLAFHQPDYASNLALVREVEALVKTAQATLSWVDTDSSSTWISRPAELVAHDWPENPNALGTFHQTLSLTFAVYENLTEAEHQALGATFQRTGVGTPVLALGMIESFKVERDVRLYNEMRDNRQRVSGKISARGRVKADPTLSLTVRRAAMMASVDQMLSEIEDSTSGRLIYGTTDQVVRVESFAAEVDQSTWDIPWSLSASYTAFPDEDGYAEAEFSVTTKEDRATNDISLSFVGKIGAQSEVAAQAKLEALRTAIAPVASWAALKLDQVSESVSGADGQTFIQLTFNEEHRRHSGNIVQSSLSVSESEDSDSGLIRSVWSGSVTANGDSQAAAYATALARCRSLGARKYQFRVAATEVTTDPTLGTSGAPVGTSTWTPGQSPRITSPPSLVTVTFSYEYRRKGSRIRINLTTKVTTDSFGQDSESVSGSVVAYTDALATVTYEAIKDGFSTRLIRGETVSRSEERINDLTGEIPNGAYTTLPIRLDFDFSMLKDKPSGAFSMRYSLDVASDYIGRTLTTTISGTAYGKTRGEVNGILPLFLASLGYTNPISQRRTESREQAKAPDLSDVNTFVALGFEDTYVSALSDSAQILQCEVSEDIECSGARIVPQATAATVDVIQTLTSIQSGRRTISGSVLATNETVALAWATRYWVVPLPTGVGQSGISAPLPPKISFSPEFVPFASGVMRSGTYQDGAQTINAKCVRLRFTYTTIHEQLTITGYPT